MAEIAFRSPTGLSAWTPIVIDRGYSSKYRLAMHSNVGVNGFVSWADMTSEFDTIDSEIKIEMLNDSTNLIDFENNLKGGQYNTITPVIRDCAGLYPLTPLYKSCMKSGDTPVDNYYELSIDGFPQPKQLNLDNSAVQYTLDIIANGEDIALATSYPTCGKYTGWTLDGLDLPYPINMPKPKLNIADKSAQLNKGASNPKMYKREFGEIVKLDLNLDEEHTRLFLAKIYSLRGSIFTVSTPLNYNFFAHLYPTYTTFQCILASSEIAISTTGHKNIKVSFSIQIQAVGS